MESSKHVIRVFLLLVLAIVGYAVFRTIFVTMVLEPKGYGMYGPYRHDDVAIQMAKEVRHMGSEACNECHDDIYAEHEAGSHQPVLCENCHAPYVFHVKDEDRYAPMPIAKSYELCLRCHRETEARPVDFPQQNLQAHLKEQGAEPGDEVCFDCHDPHSPALEDESEPAPGPESQPEQ